MGSAVFLLGALIAGLGVAANRDAPMPTGGAALVVLLIAGGAVRALLATVAVGL